METSELDYELKNSVGV